MRILFLVSSCFGFNFWIFFGSSFQGQLISGRSDKLMTRVKVTLDLEQQQIQRSCPSKSKFELSTITLSNRVFQNSQHNTSFYGRETKIILVSKLVVGILYSILEPTHIETTQCTNDLAGNNTYFSMIGNVLEIFGNM